MFQKVRSMDDRMYFMHNFDAFLRFQSGGVLRYLSLRPCGAVLNSRARSKTQVNSTVSLVVNANLVLSLIIYVPKLDARRRFQYRRF